VEAVVLLAKVMLDAVPLHLHRIMQRPRLMVELPPELSPELSSELSPKLSPKL
jgi:hypothetical protein